MWHRIFFGLLLFTGLLVGSRAGAQAGTFVLKTVNASQPVKQSIKTYYSINEARNALFAYTSSLQEHGYLETSTSESLIPFSNLTKTITSGPDTLEVIITQGPVYRWASLRPGNLQSVILNGTGFKKGKHGGTVVSPKRLVQLQTDLLTAAENNGYPFASLRLDSLQAEGSTLSAAFLYKPGPFVVWDSLSVIGSLSVKNRFLSRLLHLTHGEPFSEQRLIDAEKLLQQIPYLKTVRSIRVSFSNNRAYPTLFADSRACNQADGIIGFLPNEQNQGKLLVTGEFNLKLNNLLHTGKALNLEWQSIKQGSQKLNIGYTHPALFGTPLEAQGTFYLLKEDSTFLNRKARLAFTYAYPNGSRFGFFTDYNASSVLLQARQSPAPGSDIPSLSGYTYNGYGLSFERRELDAAFYPHRGSRLYTEASFGNKTIQKLPYLPDSAYNYIALNSVQFTAKVLAEKYLPLGQQTVFLARLNAGLMANNTLLNNELFRLGGLSSLRGFNENFFFAKQYAVATAEARFFMEETGYLLLFLDQGFYSSPASTGSRTPSFFDKPTGIGAGISFSTGGGIFNLTYALGRTASQSLGLNTSKVHFGLTGRF